MRAAVVVGPAPGGREYVGIDNLVVVRMAPTTAIIGVSIAASSASWGLLNPHHRVLLVGVVLVLVSLRSSHGVVPTQVGWEGSVFTGLYTGPYFDHQQGAAPLNQQVDSAGGGGHHQQQQQGVVLSRVNVTAQLGSHAFLPCRVKQLGNKSVSWLRSRDSHILTVDRYTFIADDRFGVVHSGGEVWTLHIKYVQSRDAGVYECQVTTEPKMSLHVTLDVVVPQTKILGGENDVFVKSGSAVVVKCVITDSLEQPDYIFWFHDGGRVVSVPNSNTYQQVERLSSDTTLGMLVIKAADRRDSGNYTCAPSNLQPASVVLHVLNGETQAGLHQGASSSSDQQQQQHQQQSSSSIISDSVVVVVMISVISQQQLICVMLKLL